MFELISVMEVWWPARMLHVRLSGAGVLAVPPRLHFHESDRARHLMPRLKTTAYLRYTKNQDQMKGTHLKEKAAGAGTQK